MPLTLEPPPWVSIAATWIVIFLGLLLITRHIRCRRYNLPPGPKPWPIIGNFNLIGPLPHRSLHALSRKYGPIMQLRFGSRPVVVGSSAKIAKAFFKTHDVAISGRPKFAAGKYTTYNYNNITWSQYGSYWKQARKLCITELLSAKRLDSYEYIRKQELRAFLNDLFNNANKTIELKHHFNALTLNIISRMVFGKKYLENSENAIVSPEEFTKMLDELFVLNGVLNIGDFIPWINFLDLQGYIKRMKVLGKKFDRFMEHVLDEHIQRRNAMKDYVAKDMVGVLLEIAEDPSLEVKLERNGVKAFTQDLIAAGTESSATTVEWAMAELLKNPEIIKKATEELDRVIGRERWVEEKDIINLPYIDAICKESMRLHPVAPMLVPRVAREDINIEGYDIPKGTQIIINFWTIGRDPQTWENPTKFQPERFLGINKGIDVKGHHYELLPFGAGRRICPGYPLALKLIQSGIANLLHGFNWKLPDNMKKEDLNMDEIFGLSTPRKVPLEAIVQPRLPHHLYYI